MPIKLISKAIESKFPEKKEYPPPLKTPGEFEVEIVDARFIPENERQPDGVFFDFKVVGGDLDGQVFSYGCFPENATGGKGFPRKQAVEADSLKLQKFVAAALGLGESQCHQLAEGGTHAGQFESSLRDVSDESLKYGETDLAGKRLKVVIKLSKTGFANLYANPLKKPQGVVQSAPKAKSADEAHELALLSENGWRVHPKDATKVFNREGTLKDRAEIVALFS